MSKLNLLLTLLCCLMIQQSFADENLVDYASDGEAAQNVILENEISLYDGSQFPSLMIQQSLLDENLVDSAGCDDQVAQNVEFSIPYLKISEILDNGYEIVLNDDSHWISYSDTMSEIIWDTILLPMHIAEWTLNKTIGWPTKEVRNCSHWKMDDGIKIEYPTSANLLDFSLSIVNVSRKEKAYVKLKQAPSIEKESCLSIIAQGDRRRDHFTLNNGRRYKFLNGMNWFGSAVAYKFNSEQKTWIVGDVITLLDLFQDDSISIPGFGDSKIHIALWNHLTDEIIECEEVEC